VALAIFQEANYDGIDWSNQHADLGHLEPMRLSRPARRGRSGPGRLVNRIGPPRVRRGAISGASPPERDSVSVREPELHAR
jgi:hypothetical protein